MKKIITLFFIIFCFQNTFTQTKWDEFGQLSRDSISARVDAFLSQIGQKHQNKGLMFVVKKESEPLGQFLRYYYGLQNYTRIITKNAIQPEFRMGEDKDSRIELWIIKKGEKYPKLKTVSPEEELSRKISEKSLFDRSQSDWGSAVNIDLFIFREGLDYLAMALKSNPNSTASIEVAKTSASSSSKKEQTESTENIFDILVKKYGISQNRINIKFDSGSETRFFILPARLN